MARGEAALSGSIARRLLETVRETGGRETGIPDSIAAELTAREVEILLLLDDRLETDEIAKRLYISEHTVRSHVKSILRKLDVSSHRQAVESSRRARRALDDRRSTADARSSTPCRRRGTLPPSRGLRGLNPGGPRLRPPA